MEEDLIEKVGRMNSQAIRQSLQGMEQKLQDMQEQLKSNQNTIGTLLNRVMQLEQTVNIMKAMSRGTGPSA